MTELRKAAKEASKVLANALSIDFNDKRDWYSYKHDVEYAANLLRQALAQPEPDWTTDTPVPPFKYLNFPECKITQPEQEPVAYLYHDTACAELANPLADSTLLVLACDRKPNGRNETPLYTAQPSKPWVSLTDEEIFEIWEIGGTELESVRAIEAALKEKNNG